MASVVARALTKVDAEKASKQDLATLKKLVMEFKDELDKLGVKVDKIDKRVAVLEKNLGGWKLNGSFVFDARFAGGDTYDFNANGAEGYQNQFNKERFRLFLSKQINENTSFYAQFRWGGEGSGKTMYGGMGETQNLFRISHIYVDTKLPYDIALRVGRFGTDFEGDYGLYNDYDALFGDYRGDGFQIAKSWGNFAVKGSIVRNINWGATDWDGDNDVMAYALNLGYKSEKWFLGVNGSWFIRDNKYDEILDDQGQGTDVWAKGSAKEKLQNFGVYAGYNFTPAIALKGVYYWQKNDYDLSEYELGQINDSPKAWKLALDIKQEALKVTSLWVEYVQRDNSFLGLNQMYALGDTQDAYAGANVAWTFGQSKSKIWFAKATQKWNDKWSSFLRFTNWDYGVSWMGKDTEWGLGIGYQYNPALKFELAYDHVSYGSVGTEGGNTVAGDNTEHVIRFRTSVNF